jgi:hypothetical protein
MNAFANAAQKLGLLRRIEMERLAWTVLEALLIILYPSFISGKQIRLPFFFRHQT